MKTFNSFLTNSNDYIINEGGAYGHLAHVFEDHDLTFSDLYELIDLAVEGSLLEKNFTTEKIDGRNILITVKDNKLRIARATSQVKNYGETTLTPEQAIEKFKGHIVEDIFSSAFKELSYYFELLSNEIKTEVFKNGKIFLNVEIQYKEKRVTIPYSSNALIFSGIREYDINGNVIDENSNEVPNKLANAINELDKPSNFIYKITGPIRIQMERPSDVEEMRTKFRTTLNSIQKRFDISEDTKIEEYYKKRLEEEVLKNFKDIKLDSQNDVQLKENLNKIYNRILFFDKSYSLIDIKKDFDKYPEFRNFILTSDKNKELERIRVSIIEPIEVLFTQLGVYVLRNAYGFINGKDSEEAALIKREVKETIEKLKLDKSPEALFTMSKYLRKFDNAGGFDAVVPIEGIVFSYKGKVYKFTGAFAAFHKLISFYNFQK
jgi:hypothetical protein